MSNLYYITLLNTHCFSMFFFLRKVHLLKKRFGSILVLLVQNVLYILCLQAIQHHFIFTFHIHIHVSYSTSLFQLYVTTEAVYNLGFKKQMYNN